MGRLSSYLFLLAGAPILAAAQAPTILPSSLPACAQSCAVLLQAQSLCVPPVAPPSSQAIYNTCFYNSNLLADLRSTLSSGSPTNVCAGLCSEGDFANIVTWFKSLSPTSNNGGANNNPPGTTTTTPSTTSTPPATAPATTSTAGSGAVSNQDSSSNNPPIATSGPEWLQQHYQWIIMLIVLIIAFTLIGVLGTVFYRRHQRNREFPLGPNNTASYGSASFLPTSNSRSASNANPAMASGALGETKEPSTSISAFGSGSSRLSWVQRSSLPSAVGAGDGIATGQQPAMSLWVPPSGSVHRDFNDTPVPRTSSPLAGDRSSLGGRGGLARMSSQRFSSGGEEYSGAGGTSGTSDEDTAPVPPLPSFVHSSSSSSGGAHSDQHERRGSPRAATPAAAAAAAKAMATSQTMLSPTPEGNDSPRNGSASPNPSLSGSGGGSMLEVAKSRQGRLSPDVSSLREAVGDSRGDGGALGTLSTSGSKKLKKSRSDA